ncbi:hypothetical protein HOLleu_21820 [Holothuria leucospilota]|uniref:Uncharacterized protein n=1 Tax=Holothuria leucospilota TaxID=206669 RepID=A0A9Q1BWX3_HOLLE|nr:hypothetical protein HOLleu_21820 [Holothuria leucospilota]
MYSKTFYVLMTLLVTVALVNGLDGDEEISNEKRQRMITEPMMICPGLPLCFCYWNGERYMRLGCVANVI